MTTSLSDKIAGILNTAPKSYDPEDDIHEETTARVVSNTLEEDSDEEIIGKFRKQNLELLEEVDTRYKGKRATRKQLGENDWSSNEDIASSNSDSEPESTDDGNEAASNGTNSDENEEDDDFDNKEVGSNISSESDEDTQDGITHLEEPAASVQIQKGQCVRQQLSMWENLLEMRIQLQKCLVASNKLPETSVLDEVKTSSQLAESRGALTNLLNKLLYLQMLLLGQYSETKSLLAGGTQLSDKTNDNNDDNEEVPSDTEDEEEQSNSQEEEVPKKRRKIHFESELEKRHKVYRKYRDSVIQKWNDKTRLGSNKPGNLLHSVLKQIEHILSDKNKLIKRTQLCRMDYGNNNFTKAHEQKMDENVNEIHNPEIFDDTDFYHQLLRELIDYKSADLTDPVQLGRQWLQLQNLRSKMKRKIDTRATKGRKIRYAVHSKLVNFMAPVEDGRWQSDAKADLYNSLFGNCQVINKV